MSTTVNGSSPKFDVYEIVTNRIIDLLEQGTIPWQQPWRDAGIPQNLISKRPYRGINVWLLAMLNYEQNLFLTWDQLKKMGGSVNRGEHGHPVVFWKTFKKNEGLEEAEKRNGQKNRSILRYYKVFNVAQCTDIRKNFVLSETMDEGTPLAACEVIVEQMPNCPAIKCNRQQAFYDKALDYINMPRKKSFKSTESYYGTLFHELIHSTGHEKRLNRTTITQMAEFGSEPYSTEELVAELGACYLCNYAGILNPEIKNRVAYIAGWLEKLQGDKRFIVFAAANAQKATDYILNIKEEEIKDEIEQPEVLTEN